MENHFIGKSAFHNRKQSLSCLTSSLEWDQYDVGNGFGWTPFVETKQRFVSTKLNEWSDIVSKQAIVTSVTYSTDIRWWSICSKDCRGENRKQHHDSRAFHFRSSSNIQVVFSVRAAMHHSDEILRIILVRREESLTCVGSRCRELFVSSSSLLLW